MARSHSNVVRCCLAIQLCVVLAVGCNRTSPNSNETKPTKGLASASPLDGPHTEAGNANAVESTTEVPLTSISLQTTELTDDFGQWNQEGVHQTLRGQLKKLKAAILQGRVSRQQLDSVIADSAWTWGLSSSQDEVTYRDASMIVRQRPASELTERDRREMLPELRTD